MSWLCNGLVGMLHNQFGINSEAIQSELILDLFK